MPALDQQAHCRALAGLWIQGMQAPNPMAVSPNPADPEWCKVLRARLTSRHRDLPASLHTAQAEQGLKLGTNAYFYVSRCEPDFGDEAVKYRSPIPRPPGTGCGKHVCRPTISTQAPWFLSPWC
jgi:hypothetical protein